jgi:hypothetical protein
MSDEANIPECQGAGMSEGEQYLVEKVVLPMIGERIEFMGRRYECTSVEWDRRDDEITTIYKNVDKEDPEIDYSKYAGHLFNNPADKPKSSDPDRPVINIQPDHPSARYQTPDHYSYNPAGADRFA